MGHPELLKQRFGMTHVNTSPVAEREKWAKNVMIPNSQPFD
jgi:hypothetical protein